MTNLRVRKRKPPTEAMIDEAIEESFPASDPPAVGQKVRTGIPKDEDDHKHLERKPEHDPNNP